jgi:Flp pilus assembly protein TadG
MSRTNLASERGAVLIQTAIAVTVMVGFGTFVADYGVLWIARHQAQNAADAGAMAGAIARAYDDFDDPPAVGGVADLNASQIAAANPVWGAPSAPVTSFTCPADIVAVDPNSRCVRVDAHRDGTDGSTALPTFFGPLLGITTQRVKATATARVHVANATNCLRPWAIPDRWVEANTDPAYQAYESPSGAPLSSPDMYTPPTSTDGGLNSFRFATSNGVLGDLGLPVTTTLYNAITDPIVPGWIVPLDPPGSTYAASRDACNGQSIAVGDSVPVSATLPVGFDFHNLYAPDSFASWNGKAIDDSCAPSCSANSVSPRLVAIAVFDVDIFQYRQATGDWSACPPASVSCVPCPGGPLAPCVSIVNIVGFFITDPLGASGNLTSYPGLVPTDAPKLIPASSFLKAVTLVR